MASIVYEVFRTDAEGAPQSLEASYDTVAEVLAHAEESHSSVCIKVGEDFLSMHEFMEKYVGAG